MLVKHLHLVHHKGFRRNSAHLQNSYGSHGKCIILAMVSMYFLSKQSLNLCWWREKKKSEEKLSLYLQAHSFLIKLFNEIPVTLLQGHNLVCLIVGSGRWNEEQLGIHTTLWKYKGILGSRKLSQTTFASCLGSEKPKCKHKWILARHE